MSHGGYEEPEAHGTCLGSCAGASQATKNLQRGQQPYAHPRILLLHTGGNLVGQAEHVQGRLGAVVGVVTCVAVQVGSLFDSGSLL